MKITIKTDNAAFHDNGAAPYGASGGREQEIARILRGLADKLEAEGCPREGCSHELRDYNGNFAGKCVGR